VTLLIGALVLTVVAAAIGFCGWRKLALFFVVVGAVLSFVLGYRNLERAVDLQTKLGAVEGKEAHAECVQSQMTNRHLTTEQRATLSSKLAAYPGVVVNTWRFTGTPGSQSVMSFEIEKIRFAGQLNEALQAANWKTNGVIVRQYPFPDSRQAVFVMQRAGADGRIDEAVKALVAGLDAACISAYVDPPFSDNGDFGQKIFVDNSGQHPDTVQADIISPARPQKNPDISILVGDAL